jgi:hypothetical protein
MFSSCNVGLVAFDGGSRNREEGRRRPARRPYAGWTKRGYLVSSGSAGLGHRPALCKQKRTTAEGLGRVKTVRPRETGDAKLNLACCRTCELDSTWFARSAVSDLVAPMRTPHWIAAMSGLHAEDVHDPREFVGEHVQGHPGGNLRHGSNSRRITPSGCSELIDETNLCISQRERDRQGP